MALLARPAPRAARLVWFAAPLAALAVGVGAYFWSRGATAGLPTVTVHAQALRYGPATARINAQPGDLVRVVFTNNDAAFHDWSVEGIPDAHVSARPGQTASATFRVYSAGTYEVWCTVPGHREAGMVGTFIVQPS